MKEMVKDALCIVLVNIKARPIKIANMNSVGMILKATNADKTAVALVRPPAGSKLEERVALSQTDLIPDFTQDPIPELKPKMKYMEQMFSLLKTNDKGEAIYNGIPLKTFGGIIIVPNLKNCQIS